MRKSIGPFATIAAAKDAAKSIRNRYSLPLKLYAADTAPILQVDAELLSEIFDKTKPTQWCVMFGAYKSICLAHIKSNGTLQPVSIDSIGKSYKSNLTKSVNDMLRAAVHTQIESMTNHFKSLGIFKATDEIQHCIPFSTLVATWGKLHGHTVRQLYQDCVYVPGAPNQMDAEQLESWFAYHAEHALLEPIDAIENKQLGKKLKPAGIHATTYQKVFQAFNEFI
jgi:hypothetical protein